MAAVKSIEVELGAVRDLALIDGEDAVWLVVPLRWWDLATLLFWVLLPADRKARVKMKVQDKGHDDLVTEVRMAAVRVAKRHVRIRGAVKA